MLQRRLGATRLRMTLSTQAVGIASTSFELNFDWKTLALYALGIGATRDEVQYLYEGFGPRIFPTFAVVPAYPVLEDLLERAGVSLRGVVHSAQTIRTVGALPTSGTLKTLGTITGIYDLKRMGQMTFTTQSKLDGQLIFETDWNLLFLDEGGFGGPRPPRNILPKIPKDAAPCFEYEQTVSTEQALLYRLSGDANPLHADPAVANEAGFDRGPILHGLATYGFCARALTLSELQGDASRLVQFTAQFRKPVWPGEVLKTVGYKVDDGYVLKAFSGGRDSEVVANCAAVVRV